MIKKIKAGILLSLMCTWLSVGALPSRAHDTEEHAATSPKEAKAADEALARQIWFKPKLQRQIPLNASFRDEARKIVRLQQYFGKKPVVLVLIYYKCATMCIAELETLESSLREIEFDAGQEFDVIAVSIDPRETPALAMATKQQYVQRYGRPGTEAGWHFLTGNLSAIQSLTQAIGFGYAYNTATDEYAHPNGILVLTPQGRISHFFSDFDYPPQALRLSLIEASTNPMGTPFDKALLLGLASNSVTGKYQVNIVNVAGFAAALFILPLGLFLAMTRRQRRNKSEIRIAQVGLTVEPNREEKGATT